MSEAATLEPPPANDATFGNMAAEFDAAMQAAGVQDAPQTNDVTQLVKPPAKAAEPTKEAATTETKTEGEIPEQFLGEKPAEKAPEADPLDVTPPANISQKASASFNLIKEQAKTFRAERDAIRTELETLKKQPAKSDDTALKAELETLRAQIAERDSVIEISAFERSPRYKEFTAREQQQMTLAKGYLEGTETKPEVLDMAASVKGAQRLKILRDAGVDGETLAAILPHLSSIDTIQAQKGEALANQKVLAQQWESEQKAAQEQQTARQKAEDDRVFATVGEQVSKSMAPYQKVEGNDAWNAQVDHLNAEAREFFDGKMPIERLAEIAYAGLAYKVEAKRSAILGERLKAAKAELAQLKAAQPDAGSTTGTNTQVSTAGMTVDQMRAAEFERAMGR